MSTSRTRPPSARPRAVRGALLGTAAVALPLALAACSGGEDTVSTGASASASSSAAPSDDASAEPTSAASDGTSTAASASPGGDGGEGGDGLPFPANTDPDVQEPSGDALGTVTDVRLGDQEGFDRVVFELAGNPSPGWDVRYTDDPRTPGEGAAVDLPGDATLQVVIRGTGYPFDTGQEEYAGGDLTGNGPVTAVQYGGVFEGQTDAFLGVESETPFRVYLEQSPPRVVVDVVATG